MSPGAGEGGVLGAAGGVVDAVFCLVDLQVINSKAVKTIKESDSVFMCLVFNLNYTNNNMPTQADENLRSFNERKSFLIEDQCVLKSQQLHRRQV